MSQDDPIPVMMRLIEANTNAPPLLSKWKDCIFITKILHVCAANRGGDPFIWIAAGLPTQSHQQQAGHPIPTTGACILTLIGKWNDIKQYNYSALKYIVTHLHDHNTDDQATFDTLQEMGCHLNACFTHPIAKQMIAQANGQLSFGIQCTITFGLVTNVDRAQNKHPTTIINPYDRTQDIISNGDPTYRHTPSVGWLCLFFLESSNYYYHLPIVDLSQHTQFMTTYNPQDLPPAEAAAYNALTNKWQNEQCKKELSYRIPQPNELNPYTYVEAWNYVIQSIKDAEAKATLEKQRQEQEHQEEEQRQLEQYINSKSIQQFEEYKRLLLEQQQSDMYNNLYGATPYCYDLNSTDKTSTFRNATTTTNQTSSFISLLNNHNNNNGDNNDSNNNNVNTNILPLSSLSASLQHTLFNEYYYKQYIKSQLDDLTRINHLQYYQYLSSSSTLSSDTTYRPRLHIALPSSSTTNTSSSSTSTIDTLIDLATSLPPPPPPSATTTILVTSTNNDATNSATIMSDIGDNNNNNNTINNTNQPTIIIPHQQTTIFNNNNTTRLILLKEQYNNILDQKHILTIQYDDLINKYNKTILQTNETYNKQITTLQQQIITLEEQLQSSNIKLRTLQTQITTLQDEIIVLKDEHDNEIITLQEECHRKEIEAKDLLLTAYNRNTTLTSNSNDIPLHILNQISFLQQQLESTNATYQQQITELTQSKDKQLEAKDKQLETKEAIHQQQILELTQSKDKQIELQHKQLESKDQQIALLMQMLAEANKK